MSTSKITRAHLDRAALIYIRQSTLAQVRENTESTARQYALADEAARLGWDASKIAVIDDDLGVSGRAACTREGFKRLVARVCMGEVGAVFGLEVSRLARSSADLQRLLEFCSLTDTLIVDADGVYDLQLFNDRLLLGLKGTMSEAELHILAGRLQESKRAAARRGDLRFPLPVGYVHDDEGLTVIDPDEEIQEAVRAVFAAFEATGSAYGVVGCLRDRPFPRRAYGGAWAGDVRWGRLTHSRALGLLANPAYTGAYVYGRFRSRRSVDAEGVIRITTKELPREEWAVVIQGHHEAYITWEAFLANQRRLAANHTRRGARPPREGTALLQGIVLCGGCGRPMSTNYSSGAAAYDCAHSRHDHATTPRCRSVGAAVVDAAVAERLLAVVAPDEIALALAAADEVSERRARSTRALELTLERAQYEAARAERAFHQCEPENRLVARSLEQRWELRLSTLAEAHASLAAAHAELAPLPPRVELETLAHDLPRLWAAPTTSPRDRKRLLRTLIADVTLISERGGDTVRVGIRWRTGAADELTVRRPALVHWRRRTPPQAVDLVRRLARRSDHEIVVALAEAGLLTGGGRAFDVAAVKWVRYAHDIPTPPPPPLLRPGEATVADVARQCGVTEGAVYYWLEHGKLNGRRGRGGRWCVPFTRQAQQRCRDLVINSIHMDRSSRTRLARSAV